MWEVVAVVAQVVFYSIVVAPVSGYLLARMITFAILMSRYRFFERFGKGDGEQIFSRDE